MTTMIQQATSTSRGLWRLFSPADWTMQRLKLAQNTNMPAGTVALAFEGQPFVVRVLERTAGAPA